MHGNGFGSSRSQRHLSVARPLVLGLILSICLAWAPAPPAWSETYCLSEEEWRELLNYWNEIGLGLQMTEQPLDEIGSYFESESERLSDEKQELQTEKIDLQSERLRLEQEKNSLDSREQELTERERGISQREQYYSDIERDLKTATKKLQHGKWLGPVIIGVVAAAAGYAGYRIGHK